MERREKFLDKKELSPDSVSRRTQRYIVALREHLERLHVHGIGIEVDTQSERASITALTFENKQFILRNKMKVNMKIKPKLTGDELITHESGKY